MTERQKVLDRIKKCLALSKSPNMHEASLALQRARELMEKYSVDDDELARSGITHERYHVGPCETAEQKWVVSILQMFFHVKIILNNVHDRKWEGLRLIIIGEPFRIEVATYVHAFLLRTFRQLWRSYRTVQLGRTWNHYKPANRRKLHHDFLLGIYFGLREQLDGPPVSGNLGLVPTGIDANIERYAHEHFNFERSKGEKQKVHSRTALREGYDAGKRISIRDGVTGVGQRQLEA